MPARAWIRGVEQWQQNFLKLRRKSRATQLTWIDDRCCSFTKAQCLVLSSLREWPSSLPELSMKGCSSTGDQGEKSQEADPGFPTYRVFKVNFYVGWLELGSQRVPRNEDEELKTMGKVGTLDLEVHRRLSLCQCPVLPDHGLFPMPVRLERPKQQTVW